MSYASVKRIFNLVLMRRFSSKRERVSSLRECLDPSSECRKRRWRPWIVLAFIATALYVTRGLALSLSNASIWLFNEAMQPAFLSPFHADMTYIKYLTYKELLRNTKESVTQDPENMEPDPRVVIEVTRKPKEKTTEVDNLKDIAVFVKGKEETSKSYKAVHCIPKKKQGKVEVIKPSHNVSLDKIYPMVEKGGHYHPPDCSPKQRVGILVPYRSREESLRVFLYNIHPFLMHQQLEYRIFVVEQFGFKPFNKGSLFNAGFKEMLKFSDFNCVVLHDVDLVPMDDRILYSCPSLPRHMCAYIRKKDLRANNITSGNSLFGGVTSLTVEQYKKANGYFNLYYGWGGEDNDMFFRLRAAGYPVVRYNKSVAVYTMLPHIRAPVNPERYHLLATTIERYKTDGLSDISYAVLSTKLQHLYTHLLIDVDPTATHK